MAPILIIRSVSLQQLDKNLPEILNRFPGAEFHLLTHPHALEHCRKYTAMARCVSYETTRGFSPFHRPASLAGIRYAAVLVPVSNQSGAGFLNVLLLAARFRPAPIYLCNLISDIQSISLGHIVWLSLRSLAFSAVALLVTIPICLVSLPFLILRLGILKKKERTGKDGRYKSLEWR